MREIALHRDADDAPGLGVLAQTLLLPSFTIEAGGKPLLPSVDGAAMHHKEHFMSENFKLKMTAEEGGFVEAFMGVNSRGWIILAEEKNAVIFTELPGKPNYLLVASGEGAGHWLSIYDGYLGLWSNESKATTWTFRGGRMVSDYNDQNVSYKSEANTYVYAWDKYHVCKVAKVPSDAAGQADTRALPDEPILEEGQLAPDAAAAVG